jgi:hypothetical protein
MRRAPGLSVRKARCERPRFGDVRRHKRGVAIEELMSGVLGAMEAARCAHSMSVGLMISVHRHWTEADAMAVLDQVMPWKDRIIADSTPPSMLARRGPPPMCVSTF